MRIVLNCGTPTQAGVQVPLKTPKPNLHGSYLILRRRLVSILISLLFAFVLNLSTSNASTIYSVSKTDGNQLHVEIAIDTVNALAGLKLSLSYGEKELTFVKAEKTKATNSLMHVVNDKKPGKLIVVMAGAKGISGSNIPLITLSFEITEQSQQSASIKIEEVQLMSEDLKEIGTTIRNDSIE